MTGIEEQPLIARLQLLRKLVESLVHLIAREVRPKHDVEGETAQLLRNVRGIVLRVGELGHVLIGRVADDERETPPGRLRRHRNDQSQKSRSKNGKAHGARLHGTSLYKIHSVEILRLPTYRIAR